MFAIRVTIDRFTDASFTGWVACSFADSDGRVHCIEDKVPIVTTEALGETSAYPRFGLVDCEIIPTRTAPNGRSIVRVTTARPTGITSTAGETEFEVFVEQIVTFTRGDDISAYLGAAPAPNG
jgi:hypothetical protein